MRQSSRVQPEATPAIAPPLTDNAITFIYNPHRRAFNTDHYLASMTHGRLTEQELYKFFNGLNDLVIDNMPNVRVSKIFLIVMLALILCSAAILPAILLTFTSLDFTVFMAIVLGLVFVLILLLTLCMVLRTRQVREQLKTLAARAEDYVNSKKHEFERRGLRWSIPPTFPNWIELWKDYPYNKQRGYGYSDQALNMSTHYANNNNHGISFVDFSGNDLNQSHNYENSYDEMMDKGYAGFDVVNGVIRQNLKKITMSPSNMYNMPRDKYDSPKKLSQIRPYYPENNRPY